MTTMRQPLKRRKTFKSISKLDEKIELSKAKPNVSEVYFYNFLRNLKIKTYESKYAEPW